MAEDSQEVEGLKEVPASEILAKIEKGKSVEYDHVIVKGDLDVSKLNLPKEENLFSIISPIKFRDSRIEGFVRFNSVVFKNSITFLNTQFCADALFLGSCFGEIIFFTGSKFMEVNFSQTRFKEQVNFDGVVFEFGVSFESAIFEGDACFESAKLTNAFFIRAEFNRIAKFNQSIFDYANFELVRFHENAHFFKVQFNGVVNFSEVSFNKLADFRWAKFNATTEDDGVYFNEAAFNGNAFFYGINFDVKAHFWGAYFDSEMLTFKESKFKDPLSQEEICRKAKNILEKNGDREEAGYHFYREMEAKRRQRPWFIRYPEFIFIQLIFGYGVHPWRLMVWWTIIVITFGLLYWIGNGINGATELFDYIKISFATAIAPGYIAVIINPGSTGYRLAPGYQAVAMAETIFGTFLWAGFIATFARKYMR